MLRYAKTAARQRDQRRLAREAQAGRMLRLHRGIYVSPEDWYPAPPWEKHRMAAVSFALSRRTPVVFCGHTALDLLGIPVIPAPTTLLARASTKGSAREIGVQLLQQRAPLDPLVLPPVHLHSNFLGRGNGLVGAQRVQVNLAGHRYVGSVLVDPLVVGVAAEASRVSAPLSRTLPIVDAYMRQTGYSPETAPRVIVDLLGEHSAAFERLRRVWRLAEPLAESPGESLSRALFLELGFEMPQCQWEVLDQNGFPVGRVDFWWPRARIAGEFDGRIKYQEADMLRGRQAAEVVMREKAREAEIRLHVANLVRWTWSDLNDPARFARILTHHGVPRVR
ncbi:MAG: hypothetical protein ACTHZ5_09810 [Micrococcaceae bacterium]